jgi:hypothetical protein
VPKLTYETIPKYWPGFGKLHVARRVVGSHSRHSDILRRAALAVLGAVARRFPRIFCIAQPRRPREHRRGLSPLLWLPAKAAVSERVSLWSQLELSCDRNYYVLVTKALSSCVWNRSMSLEPPARLTFPAWSNPLTWWWGLLAIVSGANIAVWFLLYWYLQEPPSGSFGAASDVYVMLLLSAAYVCGCAWSAPHATRSIQRSI